MKRYFYQENEMGERIEITNYESDTEIEQKRKRRKITEITKEHRKVMKQGNSKKGKWLEHKTRK